MRILEEPEKITKMFSWSLKIINAILILSCIGVVLFCLKDIGSEYSSNKPLSIAIGVIYIIYSILHTRVNSIKSKDIYNAQSLSDVISIALKWLGQSFFVEVIVGIIASIILLVAGLQEKELLPASISLGIVVLSFISFFICYFFSEILIHVSNIEKHLKNNVTTESLMK